MEMARWDRIAQRLRRERIFGMAPEGVAIDAATIERLVPHRDPMRLVDGIDAFDLETMRIRGHRALRSDDPVFAGHFPGCPIYPGALQLEMVGQLGLCLAWLAANGGDVNAEAPPVDARIIEVHHAKFFAAVGAGCRVTLEASAVESNGLTGVVAGQIWNGAELCSTTILEVYFA